MPGGRANIESNQPAPLVKTMFVFGNVELKLMVDSSGLVHVSPSRLTATQQEDWSSAAPCFRPPTLQA